MLVPLLPSSDAQPILLVIALKLLLAALRNTQVSTNSRGGGMPQHLSLTTIVVDDYDVAISFYVGKLGFELREDVSLSTEKRWVVVSPKGAANGLLLARAVDDRQRSAIGNQSGGRVFLFLETDDFARDHQAYKQRGVQFIEEPRHESYGIVTVFQDIYGNRWDLMQRL